MITGYIEGYYGVELSWKERDSIISKLHQVGCNTYFYCPKEDPYHRVRWKDDYPIDWIEDFKKFKSNADSACLLYTSPSPRDTDLSRMPSSA